MLPGVDVDIVEQTEGILEVPWTYYKEYLLLEQDTLHSPELFNYGNIGITIILPIAGTASSGAIPRYTVYMSMHDIEISGVTDVCSRVTPQSGMSVADLEARPISSGIAKAAGVVSTLATLGTHTAWGLRWLANTAYSYGFSKPVSVKPVKRVTLTNNTYLTNVDGPDISYNLGCFTDNHISSAPGFAGSNDDEMSFDHVLTRRCLISTSFIDPTDAYGTVEYAFDCWPYACFYQANVNAVCGNSFFNNTNINTRAELLPSPVFALAAVNSYYRGGFKVTIKFAKTKFHYGRVAMVFVPNATQTPTFTTFPVTNDISPRVQTTICDLRVENECSMVLNYVSPTAYLPVDMPFGTFYIRVIEPISGPPNVSSNIQFAVYMECLPGFELVGTVSPAVVPAPINPANIIAQSNFQCSEKNDVAEITMGERLRSVKQLVNKACVIDNTWGNNTACRPAAYLIANDYLIGSGYIPDVPYDFISYFSSFYGMCRGGVSYSAIPLQRDIRFTAWFHIDRYWNTTEPLLRYDANNAIITELGNPLHVTLPYYGQYTALPISYNPTILPRYLTAPIVNIYSNCNGITPTPAILQRKAAEDFQFGYYLGPPPMAVRGSNDVSVLTYASIISPPPALSQFAAFNEPIQQGNATTTPVTSTAQLDVKSTLPEGLLGPMVATSDALTRSVPKRRDSMTRLSAFVNSVLNDKSTT